MKIGITGTHGVGKTTLAYALAAREKQATPYLDVRMVQEVARRCPFTINRNGSKRGQDWIFYTQLLKEIELEPSCNILICDRSILDVCAYAHLGGHLDRWQFDCGIAHMKTYNEVYFVRPAGQGITDDGFRDVDPTFQMAVDRILEEWIQRYGISVTEITGGDHGQLISGALERGVAASHR